MDAIAIGGASAVNSLSSSTSSTTITANRVALSNALDILNQLKIYRYTKYNSPIREDLARPTNEEGETEIGLIAQHVEATPELTHTVKTLPMFDDEVIAKKEVDYNGIFCVALEAIKELKAELDALKQRIVILESN